MLFSTPIFLYLFIPVFFIVYFLSSNSMKNLIIIIGSMFFYSWGEPSFFFIAIISIALDYWLGKLIYTSKKTRKKVLLIVSVVLNVGLLVYFKYVDFFIVSISSMLEYFGLIVELKLMNIVLPIAVSFIVFEKITYLVDIYRSEGKPARNIVSYATYIFLFPKLLAGPIIKYHEIEAQLEKRQHTFENIKYGIFRFALGLFKKVWIADTISKVSDNIFSISVSELSILELWIGIICFTLQIYFDFSGYSDMAIGLSRIMGFHLKENFNKPYISQNFTEFWRRWHISLSSWIRDYLYIPLGGNRKSKSRTYMNLWICFLISGLWHGANWTFVIWGGYHGMFLVFDRMFWLRASKNFPRPINVFITFVLIMIGWVFFRSDSIHYAMIYIKKMLILDEVRYDLPTLILNNSQISIILFAILWIFIPQTWLKKYNSNYLMVPISIFLLFLSIIYVSSSNFSPFLYFRF